jgi:hypothetical protein
MKKVFFFLFVLFAMSLAIQTLECKPKLITHKKQGLVSKVKNAAAYGAGWQLGKEGAKAAIKKGKEIANSPKTKQKLDTLKSKVKATTNKLKSKTQ